MEEHSSLKSTSGYSGGYTTLPFQIRGLPLTKASSSVKVEHQGMPL